MDKRLNLCIPTLLGTEAIVANEVRNLGFETTEDGKDEIENEPGQAVADACVGG